MLRFGIVTKHHESKPYVRVNFGDDDSISYWLCVLQSKTMNDKFYILPDIGEQVACLMDEYSEEGVVLGSVYSSEDLPPINSAKKMYIILENNSFMEIDKEQNSLTIAFENINLIGRVNHDGILSNTQGITSKSDISDFCSSIQKIRKTYNKHTHIGNEGSPTSTPNALMS